MCLHSWGWTAEVLHAVMFCWCQDTKWKCKARLFSFHLTELEVPPASSKVMPCGWERLFKMCNISVSLSPADTQKNKSWLKFDPTGFAMEHNSKSVLLNFQTFYILLSTRIHMCPQNWSHWRQLKTTKVCENSKEQFTVPETEQACNQTMVITRQDFLALPTLAPKITALLEPRNTQTLLPSSFTPSC